MSSVLCHDFVPEVQEEEFVKEDAYQEDAVPFEEAEDVVVVIVNGKVVDTDQVLECDVLIENGKISKVEKNLEIPEGAKVIDAMDAFVLPGAINYDSRLLAGAGYSAELVAERTRATVQAGVTTLAGPASRNNHQKCMEFIKTVQDNESKFFCNVSTRAEAGLANLQDTAQISRLGVIGIQVSPEDILMTDDEELLQAMKDLKVQGGVLNVDVRQGALDENVLEGKSLTTPQEDLEELVVRKICSLAIQVDLVVGVLGLGSPESVGLLSEYRRQGLRVFGVVEASLGGLSAMPLDTDSSVLASSQQTNNQDGDGCEAWTSVVYDELVGKEVVDISKFVALTSTNPAKLMNLYPLKGCIRADSDADLVIWDPMKANEAISDTDRLTFKLPKDKTVYGAAEHVLVGGRVVVSDAQVRPMARCGAFTAQAAVKAREEGGCRQVRKPLQRLDCPGNNVTVAASESPKGGRRSAWDRRKGSASNEIFDKELGIHQRPRSAHGVKNQQDSTFTVKTFF